MAENYKEYNITLTMADGKEHKLPFAVPIPKDGRDGEDGYTPVKGVDYDDGYTPVKGVDYFDGYTPVKGVDYFDGKDGKDGTDGTDGRDGVDGEDNVYVGSNEPPANVKVWIDPDGEVPTLEMKAVFDDGSEQTYTIYGEIEE